MILILYTESDLKRLDKAITETPFPITVEVSHSENVRTVMQNKLLWAWYREIAEHLLRAGVQRIKIGEDDVLTSKAAVHEAFKETILVPRFGVNSTTNLSVVQFSEYLTAIEEYCGDVLLLRLASDPQIYETVFPPIIEGYQPPAMTLEKEPFWRSRKYLDWVKTLDCARCGLPGHSDSHHLIGHGGVMGSKTHDYETMPLCRRCHDELHESGESMDMQQRWVRRTMARAFRDGVVEC